jgi:hypothetical protein
MIMVAARSFGYPPGLWFSGWDRRVSGQVTPQGTERILNTNIEPSTVMAATDK